MEVILETSYVRTNTSGKFDIYTKKCYGWHLVGASTETEAEVKGKFNKTHNTYITKYKFQRISGYGDNLLFKLTEFISKLLLIIRSVLEDIFSYNLVTKILGIILFLSFLPFSLTLYTLSYLYCYFGVVLRKILKLDKKYENNKSISPFSVLEGYEAISALSVSNRKKRHLENFGWVHYGKVKVNAKRFNVRHEHNVNVLNRAKKLINNEEYNEAERILEANLDDKLYKDITLLNIIDYYIRENPFIDDKKFKLFEKLYKVFNFFETFFKFTFIISFVISLVGVFLDFVTFNKLTSSLIILIITGVLLGAYFISFVTLEIISKSARKYLYTDMKEEIDKNVNNELKEVNESNEKLYKTKKNVETKLTFFEIVVNCIIEVVLFIFKVLKYIIISPYIVIKWLISAPKDKVKFGSIFKTGGIIIGIFSLVALIVAVLFPMLYEWATDWSWDKTLKIEDGVTVISEHYQNNNKRLEKVVIPASVEVIESSFNGCPNLKVIEFEDASNIRKIDCSFSSCVSLVGITFPEGIKEITYSFEYCTSLNYVSIPDTIEKITHFTDAPLQFNLDEFGCEYLGNENNKYTVLYNYNIPLIDTYKINSSVKCIRKYAFDGPWILDDLVIPGSIKNIYNLSSSDESPIINCITLENGVETIEEYAFNGNKFKNIILPETLKKIGENAFSSCKNLESIIIPNNITVIEKDTFLYCENLKEVVFSNSLTTIKENAFSNCVALKNVKIPDTVTEIEKYVFSNCLALNNVELSDGLTIINEGLFLNCKNLTTINIPKNIKIIDKQAFYNCQSINNIVLSEGLTTINDLAFSDCISLKIPTLPSSVIEIGVDVFKNCILEQLLITANNYEKMISILDSSRASTITTLTVEDVVLEYGVFENLQNLEILTIHELSENITISKLFSDKIPESLKKIELTNETIIHEGYFLDCKHLEEIILPSTLISIRNSGFKNCETIKSIVIPESVTDIQTDLSGCLFEGCDALEYVTIPFLGSSYTFEKYFDVNLAKQIKELTILGNSEIDSLNLYNFTNLEKLVISSNITKISMGAINLNDNIKSLTVPFVGYSISEPNKFLVMLDNDNISLNELVILGGESIIDYTFDDCNIENIILPNTLKTIGEYAFYYCKNLKKLTIPNSVSEISNYAFVSKTLTEVIFEENSCLTSIPSNAFYNNYNLTKINIPNSVTEIDDSAFCGCSSLETIIINKDSKLEKINYGAFLGCSSLMQFTLPSNVTHIGNYAFRNCNSLVEIYNLSSIDLTKTNNYYLDYYSLIIHQSLDEQSIITSTDQYSYAVLDENYYLFKLNSVNENVVLPNDINGNDYILTTNLFLNNDIMTNITIPKNVTKIQENTFNDKSNLLNVYYNGTVEDWLNISFMDQYSNPLSFAKNLYFLNENNEYYLVTSIEIPENTTSVGIQFYGLKNLVNITLNSKIKEISGDAFYGCENLENVYYNGTIEDWLNIIFKNGYSNPMHYASNIYMMDENNQYNIVTNVVIPEDFTNIGSRVFYGFKELTNITFESNIKQIGFDAFYGCEKLENVYYNGSTEDWLNIIFENGYSNPACYASYFYMLNETNDYYNVTNLDISSNITTIYGYQFYGFDNLLSVSIDNNITNIGFKAFYGCENLESVYFNGTLEEWNNINFIKEHSNPMYYASIIYMLDENNEYYDATELLK